MSRRPNKNSSTNSTLKLLTASVALAGTVYGTYKYLSSLYPNTPVTNTDQLNAIDEESISNPLKMKQKKDTKISLVVSKSVLERMAQYNENHEEGIDIQNYLKFYDNLVIILYPGLTFKDLETYFEIEEKFKHRIIQTGVEESIFHVLKQIGSSMNLVCFKDFQMNKEDIDKNFRLENVLTNVISLDNLQFTTFI